MCPRNAARPPELGHPAVTGGDVDSDKCEEVTGERGARDRGGHALFIATSREAIERLRQ